MREDRMSFRVEPGLKLQFLKVAKNHSGTASDLLRQFMRSPVARNQSRSSPTPAYDEWFRTSVQAPSMTPDRLSRARRWRSTSRPAVRGAGESSEPEA